jgi:hypothetical protein
MRYGKRSRKSFRGASRKPSRFSQYKRKRTKGPSVDRVVTRNFACFAANETTASDGLGIARSVKNVFNVSNMVFNIGLIPGLAAYEDIYQFYRIDWVKLTFIPTAVNFQVDDTDTGTSASSISKSTPSIYVSRYYGTEDAGNTLYVDENAALLSGAKPRSMGKQFSYSFKPNTINVGAQSTRVNMDASVVNPVYQVEYGKWLQFGENWSPSGNRQYANYYGIQWGISSNTSDTAEWCMKVMIKFKISFKATVGNSSSNIAGISQTVYTGVI